MAEAAKPAKGGRAGARPSRSRTAQPPRQSRESQNQPRHRKPKPEQPHKHASHKTLRVIPTADAPHGRLGLLWMLLTVVALIAGPFVLAVWQAAHAGLAGAQVARSFKRRKKSERPDVLATAVGAALVPVGAAFGWPGAVVGMLIGALGAIVLTKEGDKLRAAKTAVALGLAAGSLVIARELGVMPGLFLLGLVAAHDTGNYLVGTEAHNAWEGPAAGIAAMGPVTVAAATIAVPPFTDVGPWILGGLAVVLTPLGPYAGSALLGHRSRSGTNTVRVPALRRIDALLVLGPVFAVAAAVLKN